VEVLVDVALQPFDIYVMLVADTYKTISFAPGLVSVKFVHNTSKNKHVSLFTKRNLVLAPCLSLHWHVVGSKPLLMYCCHILYLLWSILMN